MKSFDFSLDSWRFNNFLFFMRVSKKTTSSKSTLNPVIPYEMTPFSDSAVNLVSISRMKSK